jgi:arylformamidase
MLEIIFTRMACSHLPVFCDRKHRIRSHMNVEAEYDNRSMVPEHPAIMAGWQRDAAAYRAAVPCELGTAYADRERTRYDLFPAVSGTARGPGTPIVIFIHGGYWQALDRASFSHVARGLNTNGITVAVPSYDLCPAVSIGTIAEQMRGLCLHLWRRFGRRLVLSGHSAGGQLTAMMLATDWASRTVDSAAPVPANLISAGYAISGVFDLEPLISTPLNRALKLDPAEARRQSPAYLEPVAGARLDAVVGGAESSEFRRQSRLITEAWARKGARTRYEIVPDANHFTILAPLADPSSSMVADLCRLVDGAPATAD